jgi:hypothetical protein
MLQAYSTGIDVDVNTAVPFNNVKMRKGCTAVLSGASTVELNKCGVYMIKVDAFGSAGTTGDITLQLAKNGVLQPDAISTDTGATGDNSTLSFECLVQVPQNNGPCPCSEATTVQVMNTGVAVTDLHCNIVVTKLV